MDNPNFAKKTAAFIYECHKSLLVIIRIYAFFTFMVALFLFVDILLNFNFRFFDDFLNMSFDFLTLAGIRMLSIYIIEHTIGIEQ